LVFLGFGPAPLRILASGKPVAFTIHLQDVDMMVEPVERSTSKPFRTEYGCPFIEWQVAGDESFTTLIALAEHLEGPCHVVGGLAVL
jgi:hypothetical protein